MKEPLSLPRTALAETPPSHKALELAEFHLLPGDPGLLGNLESGAVPNGEKLAFKI